MYTLKKWYLGKRRGEIHGWGYCFGNPYFQDGSGIHTSPVTTAVIDFDTEELCLTTQSGSCYHLPFEEINADMVEKTRESVEMLGISLDIDKCVKFSRERELRRKSQLMDVLRERELYVQMSGGEGAYKAYYKTGDGKVVDAPIHVHVGTFSDSVLIGGSLSGRSCSCDWRFFPDMFCIECYHWDGELDAVRLENIGDDFTFAGYLGDIPCKHGETIIIKKEDFTGEGVSVDDTAGIREERLLSQEEINRLLGSDSSEPYVESGIPKEFPQELSQEVKKLFMELFEAE